MVGKLVSISILSGHWWAELTRMIDLSYRASDAKLEEAGVGQYRSATNSNPSRMLPINKKYRPKGTCLTALLPGENAISQLSTTTIGKCSIQRKVPAREHNVRDKGNISLF
jgi:hypothetical protein